jgi:1-deoxy-D-xylulose-5-phosphate reductoisomerase
MMAENPKNVVILGATGSIGASTLDIIERHPDKFNVLAISGHSNVSKLVELAQKFKPRFVVISDSNKYAQLSNLINNVCTVLAGAEELVSVCQLDSADLIVAGIVGSAGMQPVLASVEAGKTLLLANKEALVLAGELVMKAAKDKGATIIPLDSEHNAIYQCLPDSYQCGNTPKNLDKIILTASGGPFWNKEASTFTQITPEQACAHPNWDMGRKISVDSATLMNKGLEIIEAHWLFNLKEKDIDVHVHPQSIVHSMVCYQDGSVLAQLGEPDMRIPIANGLGMPERITSGANMLDLLQREDLQFFAPDYKKFPCLALAKAAIKAGGTTMAVLNAANEISVDAFLNKLISFTTIAKINAEIMTNATVSQVENVAQLLQLDEEVRANARQMVKRYA